MNNKEFELTKEIQFWAGRLIGYSQAYEVANEIVEAIKFAESEKEKEAIEFAEWKDERYRLIPLPGLDRAFPSKEYTELSPVGSTSGLYSIKQLYKQFKQRK
ncbi:MAG: hypothetical protein KAJ19_22485 [Gammaproteobacteria bacterium]|nr:hypothetical protein [Gammaproteobacteria bacterium]